MKRKKNKIKIIVCLTLLIAVFAVVLLFIMNNNTASGLREEGEALENMSYDGPSTDIYENHIEIDENQQLELSSDDLTEFLNTEQTENSFFDSGNGGISDNDGISNENNNGAGNSNGSSEEKGETPPDIIY